MAAQIAAAGVGGGGAATTQLVLNVPTVVKGYAEVVVMDASVTPASKVLASFAGGVDAENDAEELGDSAMQLAAVPEVGQVRFVLTGHSPFTGDYKINYQVAT